MKPMGMMFPVLPGKTEKVLELASQLTNERAEEYDRAQATVQVEDWFLQRTPMGDFVIVYFESEDPMGVFTGLVTSEEPFDIWFRNQLLEITGMEMSSVTAIPEHFFSWKKK